MLDLNEARDEMANFLVANAANKHSLDAAFMHALRLAYALGYADGLGAAESLKNEPTTQERTHP